MEAYILMMLSTYILSMHVNLSYHQSRRGCFLDYCDELADAEHSLAIGRLCGECENEIQKRTRQHQVSIEKVAAAVRLLNWAAGRKYCFIAMPFSSDLAVVYDTVRGLLTDLGWRVNRADDIAFPRAIPERVIREIVSSDLVIADLTSLNPNVFYEVGLTHAVGNDLLLITQGEVPFDLRNEQSISYSLDNLDLLKRQLAMCVGNGLI